MTIQLGIVMDPIGSINIKKDSSFAMLLAAQARGWQLWYMQAEDLSVVDGQVFGRMAPLTVEDNADNWFTLGETVRRPCNELQVLLMRKDPPFDIDYVFSTHLLDMIQRDGTLVVNNPQAIRDANEKLFATWFPDCCPPTLVSSQTDVLSDFVFQYADTVIKPLDGMGGAGIARLDKQHTDLDGAIEQVTRGGTRLAMIQKFIPEISAGDKRILLVDGEPVPYALARIPAEGSFLGNLAQGGRGEGVPLSERDFEICAAVGPVLKERGLLFTGIDVIGDYLTEINVTSPTCIRELDALYDLDIAGQFMDCIQDKLDA